MGIGTRKPTPSREFAFCGVGDTGVVGRVIPLEVSYSMMSDCWREFPTDRPTFSCLAKALVGMLNRKQDLVDGDRGINSVLESTANLSLESTSSDDGLLLVATAPDSSDGEDDNGPSQIAGGSVDDVHGRYAVGSEEAGDILTTTTPGRSLYPAKLLSLMKKKENEIIVEMGEPVEDTDALSSYTKALLSDRDSGFESSPKASESGSETVAMTMLSKSAPILEEEVQIALSDLRPRMSTASSSLLSPVAIDVGNLDNDVFEAETNTETNTVMDCGSPLSSPSDNDTFENILEQGKINIVIHQPIGRTPRRRRSQEDPRWLMRSTTKSPCRRVMSDSGFSLPKLSSIGRNARYHKRRGPVVTHRRSSKVKTQALAKRRRRKAVVKPPTLALDNETYLASGETNRQLPPAVQLPRRARSGHVPTETAAVISSPNTRRYGKPPNKVLSNQEETGPRHRDADFILQTKKPNEMPEGKLHRVVVHVHQPASPSLQKANGSNATVNPHEIPAADGTGSSSRKNSIEENLMSKGKRKFIRPPDITIPNSPLVGENRTRDNKSNLNINRRGIQELGSTQKMDSSSKYRKSPPLDPVSPVRYVDFQFPITPVTKTHKRSKSEDNILAAALQSPEFQGLPKTIRDSILINDLTFFGVDASAQGEETSDVESSSVSGQVKNRQSISSSGYIPVRRFSDPSSLPVSFIRKGRQSVSADATTPLVFSPAATDVTQFFTNHAAESPAVPCMTGMLFRWPGALWRDKIGSQEPNSREDVSATSGTSWMRKKVSWSALVSKIHLDGDIMLSHANIFSSISPPKKKLYQEKHPFALYQV